MGVVKEVFWWVWDHLMGLDGKSVAFGVLVGAAITAILIMKG